MHKVIQSTKLQIRPLKSDDIERLLDFYHARSNQIIHWFDPFPNAEREKLRKHLDEAGEGNSISLGLFLSPDVLAGHAMILDLKGQGPVLGIGLRPEAMGKGFGSQLMKALLHAADAQEIPFVTLTVFKDNLAARRLYHRFGFFCTGECACRTPGDSLAMQRLYRGGTQTMHQALLQSLNGYAPDRTVWTADLTYWISGRQQDGSADPAWDTETGYLQLHRDLGVMPYYDYQHFWSGEEVYEAPITMRRETLPDGRQIRILDTPAGTLREVSVVLRESCCTGVVKHMVETGADLDVMLYALRRRRLAPRHLDDYNERRQRWAACGGIPSLALPRSPLPALAYEWAGLQNMVMMMVDCPEKTLEALCLMESQETAVIDAVCRLAPPLVHFADNLSSESLTGYYAEYMQQQYLRRLKRLHETGIHAAVHLDGTVRGLLPRLAETGFDAVEALTPEPAGDISVDEMKALTGDHKTLLWGGVPGAMFAHPYRWEEMKQHVGHVLETWSDVPFVLGVADQVPPDGDITFCKKISMMAGST